MDCKKVGFCSGNKILLILTKYFVNSSKHFVFLEQKYLLPQIFFPICINEFILLNQLNFLLIADLGNKLEFLIFYNIFPNLFYVRKMLTKTGNKKFLQLQFSLYYFGSLYLIVKNLPASRAHSHRALRAPEFLDVALRARSCVLCIHLSLFLIIWYWSSNQFYNNITDDVNYTFSQSHSIFFSV